MTRKFVVGVMLVILSCAGGTAWATTGPPPDFLPGAPLGVATPDVNYFVVVDGIQLARVLEKVSIWDLDGDGVADSYGYTYEVENDKFGTEIIAYGFVEPWRGQILATADGTRIVPLGSLLFDVSPDPAGPFPPGSSPSWTVFVGAPPFTATGLPAPFSVDSGMGAVSTAPPHALYDFTIWWDHDADGQADQHHTIKVSGPTPEPCTLMLLGLSGLAMIRLLKSKRE